ncbi:cytochrome P450 CYP749A22-like [Bidens hawaiensis]|uniref:cytochrome P450 CYP749A22-like n=1 Tax=Bidens hawaiensis TaxID=980011 RepID=UPI004049D46A
MMSFLRVMVGLLCCIVFLALFKFFHRLWWVPMRVKYAMNSQGISGPPYCFLFGNFNEISNMIKKSTFSPMDISHYKLFPRILPHIDSWFHIYGKNILYWRGPYAELVVAEPELLKEIMSVRDISMGKPDVGPVFKKILGDGIMLSQGDKWQKQRKIATHAFHGQRLKNMLPVMVESTDMMLERWKDAGTKEIEVHKEFKILASEVISRTAFGSDYEEGKQLFQKLWALRQLVSKTAYKIRLPGLGMILKDKDDAEADKLQAGIDYHIRQMIRNKEKTIISGDQDDSMMDYLGLLLKAHHDNDDTYKLSIQDIIDDCKNFYSAGHSTISVLLLWVTFLLALHTEWQEKAREEVQEVFGNQNPSSEGITRLKKMGMIFNETLRLYPPAVYTIRRVPKETRVGNLVLPPNINLHIPILALHQDPGIWGEDAHLFKPERFSEGTANAVNNNPAAFIPFGYGPRICVGSNFAIYEAKITLSMILQRYRFTLSPNYVHAPIQHISLEPKFGVQIMLQAL